MTTHQHTYKSVMKNTKLELIRLYLRNQRAMGGLLDRTDLQAMTKTQVATEVLRQYGRDVV